MDAEAKYLLSAKGPLVTKNLYSYYLPFINLVPESAKTLGAKIVRITIADGYANTFRWDLGLLIEGFIIDTDLEINHVSVDIDYGVVRHIDLGASFSYTVQYGGVLDPLLQAYHKLFGFRNQDREYVEDNRFRLYVENENGVWIDLSEPVYGFGDITLKGKINIFNLREYGFYLAVQPAVKIPVGNRSALLSSGKTDFALNLLAEKLLYKFVLYLNCGWMHLGKPDDLSIFGFNCELFSYAFAVEWILSRAWSLYAQIDGNTSPYSSEHKWLDKHSSTINLGFKTRLSDKYLLQISFAEEFFSFATTDISLQAALSYKF